MSEVASTGATPPQGAPVDEELGMLRDLIAQHEHAQQRISAQRASADQARRDEIDYWKAQAAAARAQADAARAQVTATPRPSERRSETQSTRQRKDTAVISGATVDRMAVGVMRYGAIGLLTISVVGSIVAFNTGWPLRSGWQPIIDAWPRPWQGISPWAALAGIAAQGWLTLVQWYKRKHKRGLLYLSHLGIDAGLTWGGYFPILGPLFAAGLVKLSFPKPWDTLIAAAIVALLAIVIAKVPEEMLVDD